MSVNVLDLAKSYLTNAAVEKLSEFVGSNSSNVKSALAATLPVLLGGIMKRASTTHGAAEIMELLEDQANPSVLNDLDGFWTEPAKLLAMQRAGAKLLPSFFGNKVNMVTESIASESGIKNASASSLVSLCAPFLISVIGNHFKSSGMGLSGLTSMLMGQKNAVLSALPSGLSDVLDFADLGDFKGNKNQHNLDHSLEESTASSFKWLPWLIGALLLLGILWGLKNCKKESETAVQDTTVAVDSTVSAISDLTDSLASGIDAGLEKLGAFFKLKLPNGVELNIPELGIENNLIKFIEDSDKQVDKKTWFNFDRITFETGSSKLSKESLEQTKNLAEILKAFPNVNLKIGGYTDNTGDPAANLKLSSDRANSVKAAIEKEGITPVRLEAEGYGKEFPVASNDTQEGRTQNRRIAVRVSKK